MAFYHLFQRMLKGYPEMLSEQVMWPRSALDPVDTEINELTT